MTSRIAAFFVHMKVEIRFEIGFNIPGKTERSYHTVGGTVNMPDRPHIGELVSFENGLFLNGRVVDIQHGPHPEKFNVFVLYVYLPQQESNLEFEQFARAILKQPTEGEIQLRLLD